MGSKGSQAGGKELASKRQRNFNGSTEDEEDKKEFMEWMRKKRQLDEEKSVMKAAAEAAELKEKAYNTERYEELTKGCKEAYEQNVLDYTLARKAILITKGDLVNCPITQGPVLSAVRLIPVNKTDDTLFPLYLSRVGYFTYLVATAAGDMLEGRRPINSRSLDKIDGVMKNPVNRQNYTLDQTPSPKLLVHLAKQPQSDVGFFRVTFTPNGVKLEAYSYVLQSLIFFETVNLIRSSKNNYMRSETAVVSSGDVEIMIKHIGAASNDKKRILRFSESRKSVPGVKLVVWKDVEAPDQILDAEIEEIRENYD